MNDEIKNLKLEIKSMAAKIKLLESKQQQLKFPLDIQTQDIINKRKFHFEDEETGTITEGKTLRFTVDGKIYKINAEL